MRHSRINPLSVELSTIILRLVWSELRAFRRLMWTESSGATFHSDDWKNFPQTSSAAVYFNLLSSYLHHFGVGYLHTHSPHQESRWLMLRGTMPYYSVSLEASVTEILEKGILKGDSEILGKFHKWTRLHSRVDKRHCPGICESCVRHMTLEWGQQKETGLRLRNSWLLSQKNFERFPLSKELSWVFTLCEVLGIQI